MMNDFTIAFSKGYFLGTKDAVVKASENVNLFSNALKSVMEFQNELMRFGYMLDEPTLKYLGVIRPNHLEEIRKVTLDFLKDSVGDGNFKTLFGAFPAVVNSMSEWQMFIFTMLHYLSNGTFVPSDNKAFQEYMVGEKDVYPSTEDIESVENYCKNFKTSYKMIKFFAPTSQNEFFDVLVKPILISGTSITGYDKEIIEYFAKATHVNFATYINYNNIDIPFKENMCMVAAYCPDVMLKTVTDVLRYAAYISGNTDLTLSTNPKFKSFTRSERRNIVGRLENILEKGNYDDCVAEMKGKINMWIRFGERIHIGDYAKDGVRAYKAFSDIRNNASSIETFNAKYDEAYRNGDFTKVMNLLVERPGEYARRLDAIIRKFGKDKVKFDVIESTFKIAVRTVSLKVLYEMIEHFNDRCHSNLDLPRIVKLPTSSRPIVLENLPPIDSTIITPIIYDIIIPEIDRRYHEKDAVTGKYFISSALSDINLPRDMRTKSFSVGQMTRGTGIPFNMKTGVIRCYLRWHDEYGNEDLDLSGTFYSDDLKTTDCVSWNGGYKRPYSVFSGDVRHVAGDVAEYIDVNVNDALAAGMRYLVVRADDYDGHHFENDAWCGVMELPEFKADNDTSYTYGRKHSNNNFEWLPAAVTTGFKLTSRKNNGCICAVVDMVERKLYVVDEETSNMRCCSNALYNGESQELAVKMYAKHRPLLSAYEVIAGNLEARGANNIVRMTEEKIDEYLENRHKAESEINALELSINKESDSAKLEILNKILVDIKEKYKDVLGEKPTIIRYADIAYDYNKLLEYMF